MLWAFRLLLLPELVTTVVQLTLSVLVWMLYAPVFQPVVSPPRPAFLSTKVFTVWLEPRSTCRKIGPVSEQNLLLFIRMPSNALSADSLGPQSALLVAGLPSAKLAPRLGAAVGGVQPSLNEGGASLVLMPQFLFAVVPIVKLSVPPLAMLA